MKESGIDTDIMFVSHHKASEGSKPGESPFDFVSPSVSVLHSTVLFPFVFSVFPVGRQQCYPSSFESFSQGITVISLVSNNSGWPCFWTPLTTSRDADLSQGLFRQSHFRGRGRVDKASQWNTLTVDHHHPLRSFAPFGFSDSRAPFFAGAKLPSIKASLQSRTPLLSSSERKVCQIFSQIPSSSHRLSLLQQVAGLGYLSGKSFHLAPVRNTHKIPSITMRSSARGRPFLRGISTFGSKGSIFSHCESVNSSVPRLIGSPPMKLIRENTKKYKYLFNTSEMSVTWHF